MFSLLENPSFSDFYYIFKTFWNIYIYMCVCTHIYVLYAHIYEYIMNKQTVLLCRYAAVWKCNELESSQWRSLQCGVQLWWKHRLQHWRGWQGVWAFFLCLKPKMGNRVCTITKNEKVLSFKRNRVWICVRACMHACASSWAQFIQWNIHRCGVKQSEQVLPQDATGPFILSGYSGYKQVGSIIL